MSDNGLYTQSRHYQQIAAAIRFISENQTEGLSLEQIAESVGLSVYHFQRLFAQWVGISPKRFIQFLGKERAKQALLTTSSVLDAAEEAGVSGVGRMHDLLVTCEAMSPGEIKRQGEGLYISYGLAFSPFGQVLIAWTDRGVCYLMFGDVFDSLFCGLRQEWPNAVFCRKDLEASGLAEKIFTPADKPLPLHLLLKGTNFQIKVWEALLKVREADLVSYSQLARLCESPKAARAVGSAVGKNKIAYLIPCHRVVRETGEIGQYRWGSDRKAAMLGWEAARYSTGRR
ncbi:methylated-DNA--[protein]-cysteine S-methyltransferase [Neptuniibacter caesariensis]|uniref:methylated-DNA--[protein]-cysteine S-methyltransferase n=1 Tax=Neptuniibacter caesariensis TaxID=207954 RepID=A0A7U8C953_NEPCE|nr:methylated-DNA--[protein]-cysteine S-methyltransferase [Neptuniibacter caesariensis]EAR62390.1 methylated-DNA--protein-cysteine methyltransferase [Oceanospirillum sp. MED92] [Neptuniibacter caesariensis]